MGLKSITVLIMGFALFGCTSRDRGYVQREWSVTLRELGIVPVFPPREDFMVGDVYSYSKDPDSVEQQRLLERKWNSLTSAERLARQRLGMSPRARRIDLGDELHEAYKQTPSFPSTTTDYDSILDDAVIARARVRVDDAEKAVARAQKDVDSAKAAFEAATSEAEKARTKQSLDAATGALQTATTELNDANQALMALDTRRAKMLYRQPRDAHYSVFNGSPLKKNGQPNTPDDLINSRINRLRLVGFPDFASTTISKGDLSAIIPIEAFTLNQRLDWSSIQTVSVRIPAAESYAVSIDELLGSALIPPEEDQLGIVLDPEEPKMWHLDPDTHAAASIGIDIDSGDYYYVRLITEVYYARAIDVSILASRSINSRTDVRGNVPTTTPATNDDTSGGMDTVDPPGDSDTTPASVPVLGGSVELVSSSERSVGLRRVYERPIAIGFRGLSLKVRKADGAIINASYTSGTTSALNQPGAAINISREF